MEYTGLGAGYPTNRPLSDAERQRRLPQERRINIAPRYQLCVIKMNSTFLESVDKWYGWKGMLSATTIIMILMATLGVGQLPVLFLLEALGKPGGSTDRETLLWYSALMAFAVACTDFFIAWLLLKESFSYTHYPVRFNRKTKMVHVFRTNGTVFSVPWRSLFFTLGHMPQWDEWEVRGHVLDEDGTTVKETFALSYFGALHASDKALDCVEPSSQDFIRAHWEFIRRYMEDGPQAVSNQVEFCLPIASKRESFYVGFHRIFANIAGAPFPLFLFMTPFCLLFSIFRVFAMRTSKIPKWPSEIEASCAIDPGDPYAIEGADDGARVALYPQAAHAAGVAFDPAAVHVPGRPDHPNKNGRSRISLNKKR